MTVRERSGRKKSRNRVSEGAEEEKIIGKGEEMRESGRTGREESSEMAGKVEPESGKEEKKKKKKRDGGRRAVRRK